MLTAITLHPSVRLRIQIIIRIIDREVNVSFYKYVFSHSASSSDHSLHSFYFLSFYFSFTSTLNVSSNANGSSRFRLRSDPSVIESANKNDHDLQDFREIKVTFRFGSRVKFKVLVIA